MKEKIIDSLKIMAVLSAAIFTMVLCLFSVEYIVEDGGDFLICLIGIGIINILLVISICFVDATLWVAKRDRGFAVLMFMSGVASTVILVRVWLL